ncbi:MAG TPA: hypothetical protein VM470_05085 [Acidimicrobiia bacterium]|nr:hypothetical protein [Acidimicrobiia bacterium]
MHKLALLPAHHVLAHYGGIDEVGIFLLPAIVAIFFLRRSERKAREREAQKSTTAPDGLS